MTNQMSVIPPNLTLKQERFCQHYVITGNAAESARIAGYSVKTDRSIGNSNLTKVDIQRRIAELLTERNDSADFNQENWNREVVSLAQSNITDFLDVDDTGVVTPKALSDMPRYATRCIKKVRQKRTIRETKDDSGDILVDDVFEFELWDKTKALELFGKASKRFDSGTPVNATQIIIQLPDGTTIQNTPKTA